jgi:hypothetical protein
VEGLNSVFTLDGTLVSVIVSQASSTAVLFSAAYRSWMAWRVGLEIFLETLKSEESAIRVSGAAVAALTIATLKSFNRPLRYTCLRPVRSEG